MFNWRFLSRQSPEGRIRTAGKRLHAEYRSLVLEQLRQLGIPPDCVDVQVGTSPHEGRSVYNVKIRVIRWDRNTGMRLLVSVPALEARMRKAVAGGPLGGASAFGGIWLHASAQLPAGEVERDSEWAISELQAFESAGRTAGERLRRELRPDARAARRA